MATKWPKIVNNCKISEITKYGEKMTTIYKNVKKNVKKMPKRAKNGKKMSSFSGSKLPKNSIQWAETAKNGFKCFKMHANAYSSKRATNGKK